MRISILLLSLSLYSIGIQAQANKLRWELSPDGGIVWNIKLGDSHTDHIEMSGKQVSAIVTYGVKGGALILKKRIVFPMLRRIPNDTHASLIVDFDQSEQPIIYVNGVAVQEFPLSIHHKGIITLNSKTNSPIEIQRLVFPSTDKAAVFEICKLINTSAKDCEIEIIGGGKEVRTDPAKGVYGEYLVACDVKTRGKYNLSAGEVHEFYLVYSGKKSSEESYSYSPRYELNKRMDFVEALFNKLELETPNDSINRVFNFAKIRATESIYDTKGGLMHGPGGSSYYAAIWANDQAEYVNPFFPFLGNINGNESAINSFRHFARYINQDYKPIPSSIIAEGIDFWNGAGDRGDQAMIAYGASRFALAYGDRQTAKELWPLIEWCLEYLERKKISRGVISSDSDELEGRFPAGEANLSTNALTYGALVSASNLAKELLKPELAQRYSTRASELKKTIESYFGANVEGFDTYRYYDGNYKLRAWICIPLTMGIFDRKEETLKALFSDKLWTKNGILTESGDSTFWDRATLYAFRGLFMAGATETLMNYFRFYSSNRLLGEHVPYPVEAWPEGKQRHLSAESGLYCRVITEGLFGIEPTGLRSFKLAPRLPNEWDHMALKHIKAFQNDFDITIIRKRNYLIVQVTKENKIIYMKDWNGKDVLEIIL